MDRETLNAIIEWREALLLLDDQLARFIRKRQKEIHKARKELL